MGYITKKIEPEPGKLSLLMIDALGLTTRYPYPEYYGKMRRFGYPPGYYGTAQDQEQIMALIKTPEEPELKVYDHPQDDEDLATDEPVANDNFSHQLPPSLRSSRGRRRDSFDDDLDDYQHRHRRRRDRSNDRGRRDDDRYHRRRYSRSRSPPRYRYARSPPRRRRSSRSRSRSRHRSPRRRRGRSRSRNSRSPPRPSRSRPSPSHRRFQSSPSPARRSSNQNQD
ncbi:hypothetical protein DM01DRAFT_150795 [Hesseltinella vesiculosa]|uniref:PSP proline-rich domain-containing protein n=1 Tax=Hesseltinella vesiculosa TaxID=101127 RepID=A0A1X2GU23_9FUNG|nr:hypothetical protein DM01DRAFT_150795 [Hesseltinella vesiculosa]